MDQFKHFILYFFGALGLFSLWAVTANAQQGLGRFDLDTVRQNRPVATKEITHASGTKVWLFRLPGGACRKEDCHSDRERSELIQNQPDNKEGRRYLYTFSVFIPNSVPDVTPTNLIIWQLKPQGSGKPSVTIEVVHNQIRFVLHNPNALQTNKMAPLKPIVIKTVTSSARGRWLDFELDALWARGANGHLTFRLNGTVVAQHHGRNIDDNSTKQRVRFGLYRSFISRYMKWAAVGELPLQTVYFANITRRRIR